MLWIGIVIVAQAFQETPKHHAMAVAMGLFPAIAAWGLLMVESALRSAGTTLFIIGKDAFANNLAIHGMISLERGFIFTSMILASISVFLIEKKFLMACIWSLGAASDFAIGYCSFAILFIAIHFYMHGNKEKLKL